MTQFKRGLRPRAFAALQAMANEPRSNWWKDLLGLWMPSGSADAARPLRLAIRHNYRMVQGGRRAGVPRAHERPCLARGFARLRRADEPALAGADPRHGLGHRRHRLSADPPLVGRRTAGALSATRYGGGPDPRISAMSRSVAAGSSRAAAIWPSSSRCARPCTVAQAATARGDSLPTPTSPVSTA